MAFRQFTRRLATGIATFVPGVEALSERTTGGTSSASYCYRVWLRHLIYASEHGFTTDPRVVAEFGPGDSLGAGIAALLTGATTYIAVDRVEYASTDSSLRMVDELQALLARRQPVEERTSEGSPFPFPAEILTNARLDEALASARVAAIRRAAAGLGEKHDGILMSYSTGASPDVGVAPAADMLFSQAVLEHVDDLESVYDTMYDALRPGGYACHTIDFKAHHFARGWNGHWTFDDRTWALIRGRRRYAINRAPLSRHLELMRAARFDVIDVKRSVAPSAVERSALAAGFRDLSDEDLTTASAVVHATKQ